MDAETFTELALRVIAREAGDEDRRALEAEMAATPARREEFEQLRITHDILRTSAPVTEAAFVTTPELPAYRVGELRTAVRQHFGPAANRTREKAATGSFAFRFLLRWVFGGTGVAALGFVIAIACFANRTVEVGSYAVDNVRGGDKTIKPADVPAAQFVTFNYDADFDQWQHAALGWNEHAKIWVDNEHDLIHVTRRVRFGQVVTETQPLAPTNDAQREQIRQLVEQLQK